jgi:hypothetical protein
MNKTFTRLKYIFLGLFVLLSGAALTYHVVWVWPKEKCEKQGRLWAGKWMKCATSYSIETLTRRPVNLPPINGEARVKPEASSPTSPATQPAPAKK